ncbi:DNA helicase PcrA [Heliobacillus mobilis]|uniref:ATP-dependent DNA helicase n=1 Tax=Heliobacterium mobile TaxID=28064 RepID=A0A6I3SH59_HELMO|nr:DNA helicase PcrA [Heliobacterium mobile]
MASIKGDYRLPKDFLGSLNPVQREAVLHQEGPLLILAGAGSGKTRVLTHRIAHMIEQSRISPFHILAITFTNKAAGEMKERLGHLIGPRAKDVWMSTFHSACMRILRREGEKIGYDRNFVIYDSDDQQRLIKECLKELNLDDKRFKPQAISAGISSAKNILMDPIGYERQAYDYFAQITAKVYHVYQRKLKSNMAVDFDDLLMLTVRLFREYPQVLDYYQDRFQYIHVDEYQDTNHAQYTWVKLLAEKYRNLCVVGDDDQSIYGWRGADIQNILDFERDYPEAMVLKLEQNYRSTAKILEAANSVVGNNRGRKTKRLWTENQDGQPLVSFQGDTEHDEARYIIHNVRNLSETDGRPYRDFAVLYRTNAQSRVLEEHFMYAGIPYRIFGGLRFYERKEIKDIVAYLRFISNPADEISFRRIVNTPKRGIGDATVQKLLDYGAEKGLTAQECLERVSEVPGISRGIKALKSFALLIEELRRDVAKSLVTSIVEQVIDLTGYVRELESEHSEEAKSRIENIKEFLSVTQEFDRNADEKTLEEFLAGVSLISDMDNYNEAEDAVVLMTMHAAKGLEFPVVFVAGMEEGVFPHSRVQFEQSEVEEERRLCYVAITRARERLFLTRAWQRTIFGNTVYNQPSRFLEEIPTELLLEEDDRRPSTGFATRNRYDRGSDGSSLQSAFSTSSSQGDAANADSFDLNKSFFTPSQRKSAPSDTEATGGHFTVGDKVQHGKFGTGVVVKVSGEGENQEVHVAFPQQGIKKLLRKFAPLKRI